MTQRSGSFFRQQPLLCGVSLFLCACVAGCHTSRQPLRADIQSPDASERILAIKAAADKNDKTAIPLIVDRLEDEDQGVQFFAILALERLTGSRLGYEVAQPPSQRLAAIERWRNYVDQGQHKLSMNNQRSLIEPRGGAVAGSDDTVSKGSPAIPGN